MDFFRNYSYVEIFILAGFSAFIIHVAEFSANAMDEAVKRIEMREPIACHNPHSPKVPM